MTDAPSFSNFDYLPCLYCKNIVVFESTNSRSDDLNEYSCIFNKDGNGKYPELHRYEKGSDDLSLIEKGCKKFVSSGLPAHPLVIKELVKINPLTKKIPADAGANNEQWSLYRDVKKHISKEQIIQGKNLLYNKVLDF